MFWQKVRRGLRDDKDILLANALLANRDTFMNHGELHAWHYATRRPVRVRWKRGTVDSLRTVRNEPLDNVWIAPALMDLQINGYAGVDFQQDPLTIESLLFATRELRNAGCGRFLPTLITDAWPKLMARLRRLVQLRLSSAELRRSIAGWHVEGPFLSSEPGFHGAHNPELMIDPTPKHIRELRSVTGSDPVLLTIAPERLGAVNAIRLARRLGIRVSLGHTNGSAELLAQAIKAGATGFTHLGNACPQLLDRHDNILWRVLDTPGLMVSLIPDKRHVSPRLFRLIHRVFGEESIYYTTDAMSAAGAAPGDYTIGALKVRVGDDAVVRQPGKSNFAGSALRPIDGVFGAAEMLNRPWQEVWDGFSTRPASLLGMDNHLRTGNAATFCVLKFAENRRDPSLRTLVNGMELPDSIR